ncbi:holin family protein [Thalassovita taeanensis]|uniref:Holin of 3TMs, for gene-transfer release n=1 Tax=Thalassovita taeanensis TaxID=657014 RepID=A0A1H8YVF6_9RHOB|nr:holin family protein [Thalassovita taeanensis]SEP56077.1 Holin of 3TMs, for gene-transfer release [Thalassovita taeanensis]
MGLIERAFNVVFGNDRNVLRDTVEVFHENTEARAARDVIVRRAALDQFGAEFIAPQRGLFDRLMDALNRLPRPGLALGTLGMFVAAMVDPVWFAARMQGIALVPEPLWWLLGAIVSFYFGARHQTKGQEYHARMAEAMTRVPQVVGAIRALEGSSPGAADTGRDAAAQQQAITPEANTALEDWRESGGREGR